MMLMIRLGIMALEVIGGIASIAQLAGTVYTISKTIYEVGEALSNAPSDIKDLARDLETFSDELHLLSTLLHGKDGRYADQVYRLTAKIIGDCATICAKIDRIIRKLRSGTVWTKVKWLYKEKEIMKLLARLRDLKLSLMGTLSVLSALRADHMMDSLGIQNSSLIGGKNGHDLSAETLKQVEDTRLKLAGITMVDATKSSQGSTTSLPSITSLLSGGSSSALSSSATLATYIGSPASETSSATTFTPSQLISMVAMPNSMPMPNPKALKSIDPFHSAISYQDQNSSGPAVLAAMTPNVQSGQPVEEYHLSAIPQGMIPAISGSHATTDYSIKVSHQLDKSLTAEEVSLKIWRDEMAISALKHFNMNKTDAENWAMHLPVPSSILATQPTAEPAIETSTNVTNEDVEMNGGSVPLKLQPLVGGRRKDEAKTSISPVEDPAEFQSAMGFAGLNVSNISLSQAPKETVSAVVAHVRENDGEEELSLQPLIKTGSQPRFTSRDLPPLPSLSARSELRRRVSTYDHKHEPSQTGGIDRSMGALEMSTSVHDTSYIRGKFSTAYHYPDEVHHDASEWLSGMGPKASPSSHPPASPEYNPWDRYRSKIQHSQSDTPASFDSNLVYVQDDFAATEAPSDRNSSSSIVKDLSRKTDLQVLPKPQRRLGIAQRQRQQQTDYQQPKRLNFHPNSKNTIPQLKEDEDLFRLKQLANFEHQFHHRQLMLLKQNDEKRLMMARREQQSYNLPPAPTIAQASNHASKDYQLLSLIPEQNKKRRLLAQQESIRNLSSLTWPIMATPTIKLQPAPQQMAQPTSQQAQRAEMQYQTSQQSQSIVDPSSNMSYAREDLSGEPYKNVGSLWLRALQNFQTFESNSGGNLRECLNQEHVVFTTDMDSNTLVNNSNWSASPHKEKIAGKCGRFPDATSSIQRILEILDVMEETIGLEIGIIAWVCLLAAVENLLSLDVNLAVKSRIEVFAQLAELASMIARYAVMENIYSQWKGMSLDITYEKALISFSTQVLSYFERLLSPPAEHRPDFSSSMRVQFQMIIDADKACRGFTFIIGAEDTFVDHKRSLEDVSDDTDDTDDLDDTIPRDDEKVGMQDMPSRYTIQIEESKDSL
ncbi:hypothetical protein SBOR_8098 [Sclerotinia borealis F-4128]|uniref:Fungal N-terminal domain-containing protein n=1 Tax=Sclerotinia borealis (strain F-4128) TaxID=1432307 RepID=W9C441_SCLBF|nr:hypothetical protein SBOR_8098 [Sclerotinia borealis F-4128]